MSRYHPVCFAQRFGSTDYSSVLRGDHPNVVQIRTNRLITKNCAICGVQIHNPFQFATVNRRSRSKVRSANNPNAPAR